MSYFTFKKRRTIMRLLKRFFKIKAKDSDEFHKYQKIKKVVGSKLLPAALGASIVFVICLFGLIPGLTFNNIFKIDVVLSVGLVTVITWAVTLVEKLISRRIEEKIKLNGNYEEHIKRYNKEKVFSSDGKSYPLVEICPKIDKLTAHISEETHYNFDPVIVHYMSELMNAHKTSRFKNKPIYRLDKCVVDDGELTVYLSLTDIYKTLLTNRVMDFELHDHITVREVFEPGPRLNTFENSRLCNGFGFNFIVKTTDGYYALVKKTDKNPTNKFKYSTFSSSLITHFNDKDNDYIGRLKQLSYNALITNFNYPKGYKNTEIYKDILDEDIHYLGLIRNLIEGGKPELCYVLNLHITRDELTEQFNKATEKVKHDRGVDKIITFKEGDFEILDHDKIRFKGLVREAIVPLVGMYMLEKIKSEYL